jgi:peptidyl-tRNA hydrolase
MKKEDVPQDLSALGKITKEVCYATDNSGKYITELSDGWDVKISALYVAWEDIENRVAAAKEKVLNSEASPLLFFMELRLMNLEIVSNYTGFWKWQIKRHLKPTVFKKLSDKQLQRYAEAFNVSKEDIKTMNVHEDKL